jgi:hypothetical protein
MTSKTFIVHIHFQLAARLNDEFSVIHGEPALRELRDQLPKLHPTRSRKADVRPRRRFIRVYYGRFNWQNTGFSYIQVGNTLAIIDLWLDREFIAKRRRKHIDCVIQLLND